MKKKAIKKVKKFDIFPLMEKELLKLTKPDLVAMVLKFARDYEDVALDLEIELPIVKPLPKPIALVISAKMSLPDSQIAKSKRTVTTHHFA
jgi:hypothetical protein